MPTNTPALQTSVPYNLQHIAAGNAIAAAASQAIVATQQMQQGRRTASLKASYEAIHGSTASGTHELLIGRELAGATHNALQAIEREGNTLNNRRQKKCVCAISDNLSIEKFKFLLFDLQKSPWFKFTNKWYTTAACGILDEFKFTNHTEPIDNASFANYRSRITVNGARRKWSCR